MKKTAALVALIALSACHSHPVQALKQAAIDCAEAEKDQALAGQDVISLAIEIVGDFATAVAQGTVKSTVESEILKYGEKFFACVLKDILPKDGADDPITAAARQLIKDKGWQFK